MSRLRYTFRWFCIASFIAFSVPTLQACEVYDLMSFNEAAAGLGVASLELYPENTARLIDRIRWMEKVIEWEHRILKPHDLSFLLTKKATQPSKPACSPNCRRCESGDINKGLIDVSCWTNNILGGNVELIVPQISTSSGYGYVRWTNVCSPNDQATTVSDNGICYSGDTGYNVTITEENDRYFRMDVNWVVRLRVTEGKEGDIRLDGSVGVVFKERNGAPDIRRTGIYLEDKSLVYQNFVGDLRKGTVDIIAANGVYSCSFEVKSSGGLLDTSGTCTAKSTGASNFSFPQ